jgi:hypothetical protein
MFCYIQDENQSKIEQINKKLQDRRADNKSESRKQNVEARNKVTTKYKENTNFFQNYI